jgi:hypothetical protein
MQRSSRCSTPMEGLLRRLFDLHAVRMPCPISVFQVNAVFPLRYRRASICAVVQARREMPTYMRRIALLLLSSGRVPRRNEILKDTDDWRRLYAATMREMDAKQLHVLIQKTSRAMEARLDELSRTEGTDEEQKEIAVAANALLSLKVARRKWEKHRSD